MHDATGRVGSNIVRIFVAASVLTLLNAAKPVHEDDPVYWIYAAEFAQHPATPYGFDTGSPHFDSANRFLVPPVAPYWMGLGIRLLGDDPILIKCWLFPFVLLFARSVDFLAARSAPSLRTPVFWLALFSPTIVPGINLMLDLPAAALGSAAASCALRSLDNGSRGWVFAAGAFAGLAVQTKYNGAMAGAAIVMGYILRGRFGFAMIAGAVMLGLAVGWEMLVAQTQGESHFLVQFRQRQGKPLERALHLILPLISQAAGLAPAVALLGMAALGWKRRARWLFVMVPIGLVVLALVPSQTGLVSNAEGKALLTVSNLVYGALALLVWPPLIATVWRTARRRSEGDRASGWFLLLWLVLELVGYYALTPFPAARRLIGPLLVMTLLAGRLAHIEGLPKMAAWRAALVGAVLAFVIQTADLCDAFAARTAARQLNRTGPAPADGGTFWHLSWIGVSHYADREGLRPLRLNLELPRVGDRIAVLDTPALLEVMRTQTLFRFELMQTVETGDRFPLRAAPGYYDGRTPLEHNPGVRIRVFVYRVIELTPAIP